ERVVHAAERLRKTVGLLADLVGDRRELVEVELAIRELRAQLLERALELVGELLGRLLKRWHSISPFVGGAFVCSIEFPPALPSETSRGVTGGPLMDRDSNSGRGLRRRTRASAPPFAARAS